MPTKLFLRHAHDTLPDEWGASIAQPVKMRLQVPMLVVGDGGTAIEIHRAALGASASWRSGEPAAGHRRALAAGAKERSPVLEHQHSTAGPRPIRRMVQGAVIDPFGHTWLIGRILE